MGSYVSLTGLFNEPIIRSLQSKMAEIRHLENRHDVIISAEGGPIWIKRNAANEILLTQRNKQTNSAKILAIRNYHLYTL